MKCLICGRDNLKLVEAVLEEHHRFNICPASGTDRYVREEGRETPRYPEEQLRYEVIMAIAQKMDDYRAAIATEQAHSRALRAAMTQVWSALEREEYLQADNDANAAFIDTDREESQQLQPEREVKQCATTPQSAKNVPVAAQWEQAESITSAALPVASPAPQESNPSAGATPLSDAARTKTLLWLKRKVEVRPFDEHKEPDGNHNFVHRMDAISAVDMVCNESIEIERQLTTERAACEATEKERDEWNSIAQQRAIETAKWHKNSKDLEAIMLLAGEQAEVKIVRATAERDQLRQQLTMANDAAQKGDAARLAAAGMEMEIDRLKAELAKAEKRLAELDAWIANGALGETEQKP